MRVRIYPIQGRHSRGFGGSFVAYAAILLLLEGCISTSPLQPADEWSTAVGQGPAGVEHASDAATSVKEIASARRMVKAGEYSLVIPRLQQIISKYPGQDASVEARYYLAQSYHAVGAYNDALRYLDEYLELAPDGPLAQSGRELKERLSSSLDEKSPTEQDQEIDALQEAIKAQPDDMALRLQLADLYWTQGSYDQAGAAYVELLNKWPRLEQEVVVRRRMARDGQGAWIALSPEEAERRFREAEPLVIYNVNAFRSGRFEGWPATSAEKYYNVTGQAVNQGDRALEEVNIIVTIYGLGHMVYDTQTISLGTLRPREVRAFNAQFSRFDNIHSIARHECVGTFRR